MLVITILFILSLMMGRNYVESLQKEKDSTEDLNKLTKSWQAGKKFKEEMSSEEFRKFLGSVKISDDKSKLKMKNYTETEGRGELELPKKYDARKAHPECECVKHIPDQGKCGSCWAFGVAQVLTDRMCIQSKGQIQHSFSAEDLLNCCKDCSDVPVEKNRCNGEVAGGYIHKAFEYAISDGIASGGDYGSNEGCIPYSEDSFVKKLTTKCVQECVNGEDYEENRRHFVDYYTLWPSDIEYEIYTKGPVLLTFAVYDDFRSYKSGIYHHVSGELIGKHAVKVIGYGTKHGVPYWLCANSWGVDWGQKGFFKILRGSNEVEIESNPIAATPEIK